jgi:transcriptional regulator with XRE-family HTH domain
MKGVLSMTLTMGEKMKVILGRQNLTLSDLADKLGTSRQNLTNKFSRDNFSEKEIREIAQILSCEYDGVFVMSDGTKI